MIRSLDLLTAVDEHQQQKPSTSATRLMRLAVIDPAYVPAAAGQPVTFPKVTFEGEEVLDERPYAVLDGYVPAAGDRVLMVPTGTTYTIVGRIAGGAAQQGHSGGNLIVPGTITAGPRSIQVPEIQIGKHTAVMGVAAASYTSAVIPFPVAYPVGVTPVMPSPNMEAFSGTENYLYARARNITNTGFQITVFKSDAARADFTLASIVIHWVAYYKP